MDQQGHGYDIKCFSLGMKIYFVKFHTKQHKKKFIRIFIALADIYINVFKCSDMCPKLHRMNICPDLFQIISTLYHLAAYGLSCIVNLLRFIF